MNEFLKTGLLFLLGVISSVINVNAGGGSSLTLPALIFLGLDGAVANGTNRIGILVQNIFAVGSFKREKMHEFRTSLRLSLFTLPGAVAGAVVSVRLSNEAFQRILGIIMIGIVVSMLLARKRQERAPSAGTPFNGTPSNGTPSSRAGNIGSGETGQAPSFWIYPVMAGIGFYGGFIQIGVGFLLMASLYHLLRLSLVRVNMHKVFIVLIYTFPALVVFFFTGHVHVGYGLSLAAGTAFGAWWGAKLAVRGGEKAIRLVLALAIVIMAMKLLNVY